MKQKNQIFFYYNAFEMGFKDALSASEAIMNNLKNDVIYLKFIENIESSLKKEKN